HTRRDHRTARRAQRRCGGSRREERRARGRLARRTRTRQRHARLAARRQEPALTRPRARVSTGSARSAYIGVLCILLGAVCFSGKAIFVKLIYQYPIDALTLLGLRM